ncbi:MAG: aromatic amino acid ammonia-lyase [Desulfohalobiaceae bacterium]
MQQKLPKLLIDGSDIPVDQIIQAAQGELQVEIDHSPDFKSRIESSRSVLTDSLAQGEPVYGVNTGFGKCCSKRMLTDLAAQNGLNLIRFHGCGTGQPFSIQETRAAMVCRLLCFAKGYSGVSLQLMHKIAQLLNADITPVVPCEGSVGASGDLTPMSYVAAALMGERQVFYRGQEMPAAEALAAEEISPYSFLPKEPLAIMNGTAMMNGVAALTLDRAQRILHAAICASALCIHAIGGNAHHYHPDISRAKPHPGQKHAADCLAGLLASASPAEEFAQQGPETLQDPYSVRCAPQILGVLADALPWMRNWVQIEANSANDNPLFDPEAGSVLLGGNFYGGHIAFCMDGLKSALASIADTADRQVALLVDAHTNRGLPADLVQVPQDASPIHHGFKAMSISASALAAEALKATMPAASFSRSTESHNQDKVSMGTIAARDVERICTLTEQTLAIALLTALQACEIRGWIHKRPGLAELAQNIREIAAPTLEDRPMQEDIQNLASTIRASDIFFQAANVQAKGHKERP